MASEHYCMFTVGPALEEEDSNEPDPSYSAPANATSQDDVCVPQDPIPPPAVSSIKETENGRNPRVSTSASASSSTAKSSRPLLDVGNLLSAGMDPAQLSRMDKLRYLKDHFKPDVKYENFVTQMVKKGTKVKTLTFQHSWLDRYRWLVYSDTLRGGLCKFCVLFPPKD